MKRLADEASAKRARGGRAAFILSPRARGERDFGNGAGGSRGAPIRRRVRVERGVSGAAR